jgi:hypothetical protein
VLLAGALQFAAAGETLDAGILLLLAVIFVAATIAVMSLALRPRYQPIGLVAVVHAASGLVAFMLIAAGQITPVSQVPLVAATGAVLLGLAAVLFFELRKVRA